ncbi:hypothetical protein LTR17_013352 [Elasticomyces elasticus]|nr:hypothetical protein LTR17_013352 [Elasticomyces elasticus]
MVHEGMVGYVMEEFGQQKNNRRDNLRVMGGESAVLGDLVGAISSAGKGAGEVCVEDYGTFPSLVWWRGPGGHLSAILHVITRGDIQICDLIKEAIAANESIRNTNVDKTASIHAWRRIANGAFEAIKTGGVFRDDVGNYVQCNLETTVSDMLPPGEGNDATNAMGIALDMERGSQQLTFDELADVAMLEKLLHTAFPPDLSRVRLQLDAGVKISSPKVVELDE